MWWSGQYELRILWIKKLMNNIIIILMFARNKVYTMSSYFLLPLKLPLQEQLLLLQKQFVRGLGRIGI